MLTVAVWDVPDTTPVEVTAPLAIVPTLDRLLLLKSMLDTTDEILDADTPVDAVRIVPYTAPLVVILPTFDRPLALKSMTLQAEVI